MPFIELTDVKYTYFPDTPFAVCALNGVSLNIDQGEALGIVGSTGSGKSTLSQIFNGLLRADSGKVIVDGVEIPHSGRKRAVSGVRTSIGMLFQFPESQLFAETVMEDVCFGPCNIGMSAEEAAVSAESALKSVSLDPAVYGGRSVFALSGGEKRRAALAGVLAMKPKCLVLDEPTAGLDPASARDILKLLSNLNNSGMTLVIISHRFEELAMICQRLIVMEHGKIWADGAIRDILFDTEMLASHGLQPPDLSILFRELGEAAPGCPLTVDEAFDILDKARSR